ncbi:MAG: toll/interleukin-1 receptor domain-containing protein [Oscillospiraceae bacterium]|nr:toll/interleukin-1 receptor domain-containing protein [Oscillospiraceae bacterium]
MAYIYDAFISYSHRDMDQAKWLQHRLENYRIPKGLCDRGERGSHLKVFRDQTDLAGVELQQALRSELDSAEYLIVVCSPASAVSHWVDDEISYFISQHDADHVIPFIVDGEPESEDPALECYPPMLRSIDEHHFLGANVQEIGKNKAFLKLLSILLDVRFNRLVDRDRQRRLRTGLITGGIAAAVVFTLTALLWRNADLTRENEAMSYDIYGAAILSIAQKDNIEPADVEFLRTSAEAGNKDAYFYLADCYRNGWGTGQDPEAAFRWFTAGAEAGDPKSMLGLAECYENASGTSLDYEKAFSWYLAAAEAGDMYGMLYTAIDYEDGIGTEKNETAAFEWYKKSAEAGYDLAMYNLTRCYSSGMGTEQDKRKAFEWMEKLAATGNSYGMYNLGLMYQEGYGTKEDPKLAYTWFRAAAFAGDADAMYRTGWCIENGYGTENEALDWYLLAEANGNEEASEAIARLTGN